MGFFITTSKEDTKTKHDKTDTVIGIVKKNNDAEYKDECLHDMRRTIYSFFLCTDRTHAFRVPQSRGNITIGFNPHNE